MKRFLSLLLTMIMVLSLVACGGDKAEKDGTTEEKRDNVICMVEGAFSDIDPHGQRKSNVINMKLTDQVYEALFVVEPDNSLTNHLATDYTVSEDGLVYTINVREGVKFHNGEELKASDVVFSIKRAFDCPANKPATKNIADVKAIGDYTVEITMTTQNAIEPILLSNLLIVNEKFANENDLMTSMCGTGPYMLEELNMNTGAKLTAFADYWRGEAAIKNAELVCIADGTTAVTSLQSGELDFMFCAKVSGFLPLEAEGKYNTALVAPSHISAIQMDHTMAPFDNKLVRQALAHTVDREKMITISYEGLAEPVYFMAPNSVFGVGEMNYDAYPYDLEKAKTMLAEAGHAGLTFDMLVIPGSYFEKYAQVWQEDLSKIGVTVNLIQAENATSQMGQGTYPTSIMGVQYLADFAYTTDKYFLPGINPANYDNPAVNELLEIGNKSTDQEERLAVYQEAIEMLIDEVVYIPVFMKQMPWVWNSELNATPRPFNDHTFFIYDMSWN